ncbi:hypothetical protein FKP32DRAFT_482140 [Trametes sanguinea]|nr:hypothetical protein FKP32DRAFT_482140 [Trametes sanguinea]
MQYRLTYTVAAGHNRDGSNMRPPMGSALYRWHMALAPQHPPCKQAAATIELRITPCVSGPVRPSRRPRGDLCAAVPSQNPRFCPVNPLASLIQPATSCHGSDRSPFISRAKLVPRAIQNTANTMPNPVEHSASHSLSPLDSFFPSRSRPAQNARDASWCAQPDPLRQTHVAGTH